MGAACCKENQPIEIQQSKKVNVLMSQGTPDQYKSEVEKIWDQYDLDGSGTLDKDEAQTFLREFIGDLTGTVPGD